ncbi:Essential protein Yae1, N terminal [Madurella fahalii]|uniref:Protein YAE1 n=1 Tax=Madurella fahalii TaxID=1157608 RepID=A0ABQ0FYJ1_9PEZI
MTSHNPTNPTTTTTTTTTNNDNNNNDNITELSTNGNYRNETLDDVWGGNDHAPQTVTSSAALPGAHPSDMPRLQQAHSTAGYRDGIAAAKGRSAQAGFDEGFGLGATVGARAGQLLGVLEGLAAAVGLHSLSSFLPHAHSERQRAESARVAALLAEARRELSVQGVFGAEYWADDGNWRYEVPAPAPVPVPASAPAAGSGSGLGSDGGEFGMYGVVFADVAAAHPLLRKWSAIVREEAERYGVDWEVLKDEVEEGMRREELEGVDGEADRLRRDREARPAVKGREALAW